MKSASLASGPGCPAASAAPAEAASNSAVASLPTAPAGTAGKKQPTYSVRMVTRTPKVW